MQDVRCKMQDARSRKENDKRNQVNDEHVQAISTPIEDHLTKAHASFI